MNRYRTRVVVSSILLSCTFGVVNTAAAASSAVADFSDLRLLLCTIPALLLVPGFALVSAGFTRARNAAHTMGLNLMVVVAALLGYGICGYLLQTGTSLGKAANDSLTGQLVLLSMVLLATTASIPVGAMAERLTVKSALVYGLALAMVAYPLVARWVWGGGWLSLLGARFGLGHGMIDTAGSGVVHLVAGVTALAGSRALGPRIGKYRKDGRPNAIPGHHIPMAITGTLLLLVGWFGLTTGSTLAAGAGQNIATVAVNTLLAAVAAAGSALLTVWIGYGKPDISICANGLLAGLVAISAPCGFVTGNVALLIGLVAGLLCCGSIMLVEQTLKIDDPVGAISIHGVCGIWGLLAVGLFADGSHGSGLNQVAGPVRGLFYGDAAQLGAEVAGILAIIVFIFAIMYPFFKVLNRFIPLRVAPEIELEGVDRYEVGAEAYPDFNLRRTSL